MTLNAKRWTCAAVLGVVAWAFINPEALANVLYWGVVTLVMVGGVVQGLFGSDGEPGTDNDP